LKHLIFIVFSMFFFCLSSFSLDFYFMAEKLLERDPQILLKKLEYETALDKESTIDILKKELDFNRVKCEKLKKLVSVSYDYNLSQLETKKYTFVINLKMYGVIYERFSEPLEVIKMKLKSFERRQEYLIDVLKIIIGIENVDTPGLIDLENIDMSILFMDFESLLNISGVEKLFEAEIASSVNEILQLSAQKNDFEILLIEKIESLRDSFDLLNAYKMVHDDYINKIEEIEDRYKLGEISNQEYIKSQLDLVDLKIKLLNAEKNFVEGYLEVLELLGLSAEKYLFK